MIAALLAATAQGTTWPIPGPSGEGFDEVLILAENGDVIEVGDDYMRTTDAAVATIEVDLTIEGGIARPLLPTLHIKGATVLAQSVTLQGHSIEAPLDPYDQYGAWVGDGALTLVDATLLAAKDAALFGDGAALTLQDVDAAEFGGRGEPVVSVVGGSVDAVGGAFAVNSAGTFVLVDADGSFVDVAFSLNSAIQGADIAAYASVTHTLDLVEIESEAALSILGGGSSVYASGMVTSVQGSTFTDGFALGIGGALSVDDGGGGASLEVSDTLFAGNYALVSGGAIAAVGLDVVLQDVDVRASDVYAAAAGVSGGALWQSGGTLDVQRGKWQGTSALDGGALALTDVDAVLTDLVVEDCGAVTGGAIHAVDVDLFGYDVIVRGCEAAEGGAVVSEGGSLRWAGGRFEDNGALGPIVMSSGAATLELVDIRWCNNDVGLHTGVVVVDLADSALVQRNVFLGNAGADLSASILVIGGIGPVHELWDNDFVGEALPNTVASDNAIVSLQNNIVHGEGAFLDLGSTVLSGGWNLWSGASGMDLTEELVGVDPGFVSYVPGDCDSDLHLVPGSPAVDAGTPAWTDADGTRSDIGVFDVGFDVPTVPGDLDGDGFVDDDCAPEDPSVHPGANDVPYDGLDQDCDGMDLCDADGDGHDAGACGGDDCNDQDESVFPGANDPGGDDVDGNCSGSVSSSRLSGSGGCGCDTAGGGWVPWVAILAMARRRESRSSWPHPSPPGPSASPLPRTRMPDGHC